MTTKPINPQTTPNSENSGKSGAASAVTAAVTPPDTQTVRKLFDAIAGRYDRFNSISSFGRDGAWRKKALEFLQPGMRVLDMGTGTGDLAFEAARRVGAGGAVVGIDVSEPMLSFAAGKNVKKAREAAQAASPVNGSAGAGGGSGANGKESANGAAGLGFAPIRWVHRGAQELPLDNEKPFDAVVSAFVLRNVHSEIARVLEGVKKSLKPGGRIAFLDLTEPESKFLSWGSRLYMSTVVLAIGTLVFRDPEPVRYLKASMQRFFKASEFKKLLTDAGFENVRSRSFLFGAVTLYEASTSTTAPSWTAEKLKSVQAGLSGLGAGVVGGIAGFFGKVRTFLEMIKFEHTVFALPFAYLGYVFGARGQLRWSELGWITLVMVAARTAGMCLNRIVDIDVDAKNPRTRARALVTGALTKRFAAAACALSFALLIYAVLQLPPICVRLLPVAIALLIAYHFMKRFTFLCHFGVGLVLACAPMGGWLTATGAFEPAAWALSLAVLLWVGGFDLFYSLQDADFDRSARLYSIPARFGEPAALQVAFFAHLGVTLLLGAVGIMLGLGWVYWTALTVSGCILGTEHYLVRQDREKHVNAAFFTLNGILSVVFCGMAVFSYPISFSR